MVDETVASENTNDGGQAASAAASATAEPDAGTTQQQPSSETVAQPEAQQPAEGTPAAAVVDGAPDQYEFTAPEGLTYDPEMLSAYSEAAKAANLSQDAAQKLIASMAPKLAERQAAEIAKVREGWAEETKNDAEIGGANFQSNLAATKAALKEFDPSGEMLKLLKDTGLENHRAAFRFLANVGKFRAEVGKAISEDKFMSGGASPKTPTTAKELYDAALVRS